MDKKFLNKLDAEDKKVYQTLLTHLEKLPNKEKDEFLAGHYLITAKIVIVLEKFLATLEKVPEAIKNKTGLSKEIKEIENIVSFGPTWLNVTRKVKKRTK